MWLSNSLRSSNRQRERSLGFFNLPVLHSFCDFPGTSLGYLDSVDNAGTQAALRRGKVSKDWLSECLEQTRLPALVC